MPKSTHISPQARRLVRVIQLMLVVVISVVALARAALWFTSAQSLPADAKATCTVTPAVFATWFTSGSVTVNGVVEPANSVTFPNTPNCSFYQWSEQMFLWLTSPAPARYGGGKHIFDSPTFYDVSPPDQNNQRTFVQHVSGKFNFFVRSAQVGPNGNPVIFDKLGKLIEIKRPQVRLTGKPLIRDKANKLIEVDRARIAANGKPIFQDRTGKTIDVKLGPSGKPIVSDSSGQLVEIASTRVTFSGKPIFLDKAGNVIEVTQGQAGGGGVLMTQNNSLVYYTTQVNDVFAYFLTGQKNSANGLAPNWAPVPDKFPTTAANLAQITAFAATKGKTFPDANALAIEVKSAWVEASAVPDASKYITMTATIPTYDTSNPDHWVPNGSKSALLAMVGMHVVGSTKGHPEMIWATFEHFGNTPNASYTYTRSNNLNKVVPQDAGGPWLFAGTPPLTPFNEEHMNVNTPPNIDAVNPFSISPSSTLRVNPWGSPGASAAKNTEVIAINNSVLGMLLGGDVRKNYMFNGATWTIGGASPAGANEVGTNQMANTTMETYDQPSNCFSCHHTNTVSVSHIFGPLKPLFTSGPASIYATKIQPIWDQKCTLCHSGGAGAPQGLDLSSGVSFNLLVNVNSKELPSMKRIKPNDVANSYLVHKVEGTQGSVGGSGSKMPQGCSGASCLSATQISDLKAWINAGAMP